MTPLIHRDHFDRVAGFVERARANGDEIVRGGRPASAAASSTSRRSSCRARTSEIVQREVSGRPYGQDLVDEGEGIRSPARPRTASRDLRARSSAPSVSAGRSAPAPSGSTRSCVDLTAPSAASDLRHRPRGRDFALDFYPTSRPADRRRRRREACDNASQGVRSIVGSARRASGEPTQRSDDRLVWHERMMWHDTGSGASELPAGGSRDRATRRARPRSSSSRTCSTRPASPTTWSCCSRGRPRSRIPRCTHPRMGASASLDRSRGDAGAARPSATALPDRPARGRHDHGDRCGARRIDSA